MKDLRVATCLARSASLLAERIAKLEPSVQAGDETAWEPYQEAVMALAAVLQQLPVERQGAFLTTREMAARLNISPKTLLRRKSHGEIRPALQKGKLIRWKGNEV